MAVSLRDESIFGASAVSGARALATSAFMALVNAFFVSLLGLVPGANIGYGAAIMALVSIGSAVRLQRGLPRDGSHLLIGVITVATFATYGAQLFEGVVLLARPHDSGFIAGVAYQLFFSMAVALERAWVLISGAGLKRRSPPASDEASDSGGNGGA